LDVILTDAINGFSSQHLLFKELERNGELNAEFGHFEAPKVNCLIYILWPFHVPIHCSLFDPS